MKKQYVESEVEILTVTAEDCISTSYNPNLITDPNVPDSTPIDFNINE